MTTSSRHKLWLPKLTDLLDQKQQRVFSQSDLRRLLIEEQVRMGIPSSTTLTRFITVLCEESKLREIGLRREERKSLIGGKKRYVWGEASPYGIGLSLAKGGYLSHASAVFLHALTEQVPKTIYINKEQRPKPPFQSALSQPAIGRAFKNAPRTSKYVFISESARFVLLSGKNTGNLEVSDMIFPNGEVLQTTNIERTLIDIVVRPAYAGGIYEILAAYKTAARRVSVDSLLATLRKLNYVYPYHQSVGFLLERAGFDEIHLEKFAALGINWDFYLDYGLQETAYDRRWRLYYPKGL